MMMMMMMMIYEIEREISRSRIVIFHTPLHSTPPLGESPSEYCHPVWCGKTSTVYGCPTVKIFLRVCVTV